MFRILSSFGKFAFLPRIVTFPPLDGTYFSGRMELSNKDIVDCDEIPRERTTCIFGYLYYFCSG